MYKRQGFEIASRPSYRTKIRSSCVSPVHNKCYDYVYFTVNYKDTDGDRITRGNFSVVGRAGKTFVANTTSPIFYFYAESENGKNTWAGNDLYR